MADWVFDSVVGFLYSPMWTVPIVNFIEHKCIVFDPDEELKSVYKETHREYKELVEFLLENFLQDVGITSEQFVSACKRKDGNQTEETYAAFEQVEAAQDLEVFIRMMVQKNIELELQALRLIQERNGVIPESLTPTKDQHYSQVVAEDEDEKILQEVLRKSKEEYEAEQSKKKKGGYDTDMEKALANSQDEQSRLHADRQREQEMLDKALKLSLTSSSTTKSQASLKGLPGIPKDTKSSSKSSPSKSPAPAVPVIKEPVAAKVPTKAPNKVSSAEAAASWLSSAKAEAAEQQTSSRTTASEQHSNKLASSDAAELKRREDYLRLQRDKLLAMKKQEREKTLDSFAASSQGRERPRSARAAKQATQGEGKPKAAPISAEDQKKLAMRQALAARLKEEVINKK